VAELRSGRNTLLNIFLFIFILILLFILYTLYLKFTAKSPDEFEEENPTGSIIQVEVLNGTNVRGLAEKVTNYLRSKNVDVVQQGNHKRSDVLQSYIIDRTGNQNNAKKLARILGINYDKIRTEVNHDFFLDLTIVIGADYQKLKLE
jgi:hypothetical protein